MATTDAKPVPVKNVAYRVTFPIFDADGDLVTGATGLDSEVSKDAGTFADCTNEATEIATSSGIYYLDLTSTEMNADTVAVIVKTSSSGAKTTPIFLYPQEAGDIPVTVEAMNAGTVTAAAIAADAITDAKVASDVTIASVSGAVGSVTGAVGSVTGAVGSVTGNVGGNVVGSVGSVSGAVGSVTGNVGGNVAGSVGSVTGSVGSVAAGGITASSIATGAVDANALAADAVAEIQSGLATAAKLLSYIQSIARNDVTVDSDIGGTYDDATDSLQAIRDRGDAAWVSGSSTALLTGTASAGAAGSITLAGGTATDDIYNYAVVSITSGTGAGQTRVINDYVGSTKVATIAPDWAVTPDNTSVFRVDPFPSVWSAVTRTLTGANAVTFNGPVLTSGNVQIVEGDDYHETEGLNLSWAWTDATASYTSATATFYAERPGGADFSKALYSVTKAGSTVTGLMRLTAAESALLTTGAPWSFQIRVTFSSGRVSTKVRGSTDVIARIGT